MRDGKRKAREQKYIKRRNVDFVPSIYRKERNPADDDRINRINVVKRIESAISDGKELDEIVNALSKDEVIKSQFSYLEKHGIDLSKTFKSWYENKEKNKDRKSVFIRKGE